MKNEKPSDNRSWQIMAMADADETVRHGCETESLTDLFYSVKTELFIAHMNEYYAYESDIWHQTDSINYLHTTDNSDIRPWGKNCYVEHYEDLTICVSPDDILIYKEILENQDEK